MQAVEPDYVKFFIGALYSDESRLEQAKKFCVQRMGPIELESKAFAFTATHYYDAEMGPPIYRQFFSFEGLRDPGDLPELKVVCNQIEAQLSLVGKRKVNLDIGYLDLHKMILASAKYNGQKVYLDQGIYADVTLIYEAGGFHPTQNTFPDFKSGEYLPVFREFREHLKADLRQRS